MRSKRPVTIYSAQWADLPFETLCGKIASLGYDGIELACHANHMDVSRAATDPAYVKWIKDTLAKHNLGCWAFGSHLVGQCVTSVYDYRYDNILPKEAKGKADTMREWAVEEMKTVARAAKAMGVKVVTGFTGSPIWNYWYSFPQITQSEIDDAFKLVADIWNPILDVFDECGVQFAHEVHATEIAFDFYTTERLLKTLNRREAFGLNFDPSHLFWQGLDPASFIREFGDRIYHVHMKDVAVTRDGRSSIIGGHLEFGDTRRGWNFRSLGHGHVDFDAIMRELNNINYAGPLSVEWEDTGMDREYGARESCEFVRRYDFPPSDFAFDSALRKD